MENTVHRPQFSFYTSSEYWHELIRRIDQAGAGDRIGLMTMEFDPRYPVIHTLMNAVQAATKRGVIVQLLVDAATFLRDTRSFRPGPLWYPTGFKRIPGDFVEKYEMLQRLAQTPNIDVALTNRPTRPFSNMVGGRSHMKISLINDRIFIGGCNLAGDSYDLMVSWEDRVTANYLHGFMRDVHAIKNVSHALKNDDLAISVSKTATLMLDCGARNRSGILTNALRLIDNAREQITITCQFFPNSVTAKHLAAAYRRGVEVTIVYAGPDYQRGLIGGLGQRISIIRERLRVPPEFFALRMPKDGLLLHAKLLATDAGTIIGSHNYVRAGVLLGTAEIALMETTPEFRQDALAALTRELSAVEFER